jgi:drug/metabolite transporter (DMT)-like permease
MNALSPTMRGIVLVVGSQLAFLLNDTLIKLAGDTLPMGEIIFLRGLVASVVVGFFVLGTGMHRHLGRLLQPMVLWRGIGELGGTFFYLVALFNMPIANATIIFQAVPLSATAGAALFLREAVGWRRWLAILVGFLGVLMVVRPGLSGFDAYGLMVLVSVLFVSLRDLSTRAMPAAIPTVLVTFVTAASVTVMGALMGLGEAWSRPTSLQFVQIAGAGLFLSVGYVTIIAAMRFGDISLTAPFRYVAVVFAIVLGYLVWRDVPDVMTILGSAVIVGTGLYTFNRERMLRLRNDRAAPAAIPAAPP